MSKLYMYPLWLRIWHLINALCFLTLVVTGLAMAYQVPPIRFDYGVSLHNITGIVLTLNYLLYLILNASSGNFRFYRMKFSGLIDNLKKQIHYYSKGLFKGEPHPFPVNHDRKFNPLQQLSYVLVMYIFLALIVISGWFLLFPTLIFEAFLGIPGLLFYDQVHFISACIGFLFMLIHVYFCTIGATPVANFKSMVNGYHEAHD